MCGRAGGSITRSAQTMIQPILDNVRSVFVAGQPVHDTHPQLLGEGELQPGVHSSEFAARRNKLAQSVESNSLVILPSADVTYITGVIPHYYRQDTNFLYMTGINQESIALIETFKETQGEASHKLILFIPVLTEERQIWEDVRMNIDAAKHYFGAEEAYPLSQFRNYLEERRSYYERIFFDYHKPSSLIRGTGVKSGDMFPLEKLNILSPLINQQRFIKSPAEQKLMERSVEITTTAIQHCIQTTVPNVEERILRTNFEYLCKLQGAQSMAFPAVVASGANACSIHYGRCDSQCQQSDLLLVDAGCEYFGYVSDVSRTWPVGKCFSSPQLDLYSMINEVHDTISNMCKPGTPLKDLHGMSVYLICDGLQQLGLLDKEQSLEEIVKSGVYKKFYPHSVGHWLGLDCHDTPTLRQDQSLQAGVILTVEPGVYVPEKEEYGHFGGIGIRIEDDVLITEDGYKILSNTLPHKAEDIAALVGSKR